MEKWLKEFNVFLSGKGLRRSVQREWVAKTFFASSKHIGIEELYRRVLAAHPGVGIATVYRTLNLLVESGLAIRRDFVTGAATYEKRSAEHHDHLLCTRCGKIVEFGCREIEDLQEKVASDHGFELRFHKMELYGLCPPCRRREMGGA